MECNIDLVIVNNNNIHVHVTCPSSLHEGILYVLYYSNIIMANSNYYDYVISVNREVREHLYSIAIVDLIFDPAFRGGLLHFEPSDL